MHWVIGRQSTVIVECRSLEVSSLQNEIESLGPLRITESLFIGEIYSSDIDSAA